MTAAADSNDRALTAMLTAKPDTHDELLQTLCSLVADFRAQPGCILCVLGQEVVSAPQPPRLVLSMAWEDAAAMEAFLGAESFRVLLGATTTLSAQAHFRFSLAGLEPVAARIALPGRRGPH